MIVVAMGAAALACWIVVPDRFTAGSALALAALLHLARLARWAGDRTFRERLLVIVHVGYLFVPLGFGLCALAAFGVVPASAGIHAWMVRGAGTMTLAVMSRATLGHTGQPLTASWVTQTIYLAIILAAVARICAVLDPADDFILLHIAACAWVLAFFGYAIAFGPLLVGSKLRALAMQ
jgi:uncharacterized protein involved in response to NO